MAGTVVVVFTDIVGSTELSARLGDDHFDALRRAHFDVLEREVGAHDGVVVKSTGDGVMATFGSASNAVSGAVAIQGAVAAARRNRPDGLEIRIGVSAGDAAEEDGDWYGTPVNEAARLCAAAASGQILVSEVVRLLAGTRGGHEFAPVGALELKGLPEPVVASEVRWVVVAEAVVPFPAPLAAAEGELPFSGRADALAELQSAWKQTTAGGQRAVLVAGEPGVGKTRLVSELARAVHADGATVLLGRASEHGGAAYGPWREALRALVRQASDEVLAAHVAGYGGELARLVPDLARRLPDLPAVPTVESEIERDLLFEAVGGLLDAAATDGPILVVLDDLHWADRPSLLLLLDRLRGRSAAPVLLVGTYRDTDVDRSHPLSAVLADLRREPCVARVSLDGLGPDAVTELLTNVAGHDLDAAAAEFASVLQHDTNGNPFFVGEVLRHLIETGALVQEDGRWVAGSTLDVAGLPEGVREVLGRRLAELPEATNIVLGVASVLGQEFDVTLLAAVWETDPGDVLDALDPAVQAQLVREVSSTPGHYVFAHALVRAVLAEELGTNRRVRLHRAAGLALEARPEPPLARLAYHFGEAAVMGETERAVRYAVAAAEESLGLLAPEQAVALARRALDAADLAGTARVDRVPLQELLGRSLNQAGEYAEGRDVIADAFAVALAADDVATAHRLAIEYGGLFGAWEAYGEERGPRLLDALLEALPAGDSPERVDALLRFSYWHTAAPGSLMIDVAEAAYEMAVRIGDPRRRAETASTLALALRSLEPARVVALCDEALALGADEASAADLMSPALYTRAEARLMLGDLDGADHDLRAGFTRNMRRLPARLGFAELQWEQMRALLEGRLADAEAHLRALEEWPGGQRLPLFTAAVGSGHLAYLRGDWAGERDWLVRAREIEPLAMAPYHDRPAPTGGVAAAAAALRAFLDTIDPLIPDWTRPVQCLFLADTVRLVGDADVAREMYGRFSGLAGWWAVNTFAWSGGPYDRGLGVYAATAGDLDAAVDHLDRAVAMDESIGSPAHAVIDRLELAAALINRGGPGDAARAATEIDTGRSDAERVGMPGWTVLLDALAAGDCEPWRLSHPD